MLTAINIAQWDILGKASGLPVYKLLGGKAQEKLMVYNTMNGWPINGMREHTDAREADRISAEAGDQGHQDLSLRSRAGQRLRQTRRHVHHAAELKQSLDPIQRMRKAAGDEIEIALDLSSKWNLPCSLQIAHSLEPYGIMWIEDPMLADNLAAYASLARETSIPICISERLATRFRFREMFELHAVDVVMYDVTWCGGISEAKKISDMADTYKIPTAPHTGGGPILWFASIHTATSLTNFYIMESVYHLYNDVYPHFLKECSGAGERLCDGARHAGLGNGIARRGRSATATP